MVPILGRAMSTDRTFDDDEDVDLSVVDLDAVSTGAGADSADWDERMKRLPRVLRFAMLISRGAPHIEQRLIAEINELCPHLQLNAAWAAALDAAIGLTLAADLDRRAVSQNEPNLRSLADCVRLTCLPVPLDAKYFAEYRRVGKALVQAFHMISRHVRESLCCDLERFVFGWAALPACTDLLSKTLSAAVNANDLGKHMAERRIVAVKSAARRQVEEEVEKVRKKEEDEKAAEAIGQRSSPAGGLLIANSWWRASRATR
jgi:ATP-dependent Lon protease